ncbi:MAG: GNAT family N-acetyltransferase [Candidatus Nanopelagicales bacterium]
MDVILARPEDAATIGRLLHDFNVEYDEPTPSPAHLAQRVIALMASDTAILLADDVGLVVLRFMPAIWTDGLECYLAEFYVRPDHRGRGIGTALLSAALGHARDRGADYIHLGTTADDDAARHVYEKAGFSRTEGDGGPLMFVYEREL